jgi:hypothetical protein
MERAGDLLLLERHQPYRLLLALRIARCAGCRSRWPCPTYADARSALLSPSRVDLAETLRPDQTRPGQPRPDRTRPACPDEPGLAGPGASG